MKKKITKRQAKVREHILDLVGSGMREGDLLPTVKDLADKLELSQMTVHKAVNTLVAEGVIFKKQGKGTFVGRNARLLRPGGRIVLSDLDASGYRIFDRVFAAEGRAHARSRFRFGELADCLRGEGLRVRRFRAERQELLIAERNGRGGVTQERRPQ